MSQAAANPPPPPQVLNTIPNSYKKDANGKYWFQRIPEQSWNEKTDCWKNLISRSIIDYGAFLVEHNLINKENNNEIKNYILEANNVLNN